MRCVSISGAYSAPLNPKVEATALRAVGSCGRPKLPSSRIGRNSGSTRSRKWRITGPSPADLRGMDQLQRGAHLPIRALAGELGGQRPGVDLVPVGGSIGAHPVPLV